jgi:hypothetical protein
MIDAATLLEYGGAIWMLAREPARPSTTASIR